MDNKTRRGPPVIALATGENREKKTPNTRDQLL